MDWIWPKKCVNCGRMGSYVCKNCQVGLWEEEQICPACQRASRYGLRHKYCHVAYGLDGLTCLWAYDGAAKAIIKKAKYKYYFDKLKFLIDLIDLNNPQYFSFQKFLNTKPIVVPVPLYEKRYRERGFNQADIIGKLVASRWSLAMTDLLRRTKETGHQAGRTREERLMAIKNAFQLRTKDQLPKAVLLVDDVWTTGATMSECCKILKQNGAAKVWGLVLAR